MFTPEKAMKLYWVYVARFWQQGGCRGGLCERRDGAASMSDTASSKTDPPLAKAEPIGDTGSTSVII